MGRFTDMRRLMPFAILAAALIAPAASAKVESGEEVLAKTLAGATPGKAQSCYSTSLGRPESETLYGVGILYRSGKTYWVNRFQGGCPQLDSFSIIVSQTPTGQFCRGDIARIVDQSTGIQKGTCLYGDFVPYKKAK